MFDDAGGDPSDACGLASIVAEGELVEIGLQVLLAHRARVRAEQPALQERNRPVAGLQGVVVPPLRLGLHDHVMRPRAEAALVVARKPVGDDMRVGRHLPVGKRLQRGLIVVLRVRQAHPSARLGGHQNQLFSATFCPHERLVDLHERAECLALRAH